MKATGEQAKKFSLGGNFATNGGRIRSLVLDGVCTLSSWLSLDIGKCDEAKFRGFSLCLPRASGD